MGEKQTIGLLVMAYGTPYSKEDIEPYYTAIRHGRKPSPQQIDDLARRYEAIGGSSPLAELTTAQAAALEKRLNEKQNIWTFKHYLGLKYIHPFIEDAVGQMKADGIDHSVALVLAPHYSRFSVQSYADRALAAADGNITITPINSWYRQPDFIRYWSRQVQSVLDTIPAKERKQSIVIFSAHSLPTRILAHGDPYPDQVEETTQMIAESAGLNTYARAWQSAGKTPDPWLGPDILEKIKELDRENGYKHYIFCPIGFVAEHLEVLYDNDTECRKLVATLGAVYHRPPMPDTDPQFIEALASTVLQSVDKKPSQDD